jgi:hypothetical protein
VISDLKCDYLVKVSLQGNKKRSRPAALRTRWERDLQVPAAGRQIDARETFNLSSLRKFGDGFMVEIEHMTTFDVYKNLLAPFRRNEIAMQDRATQYIVKP